MEEIQEDLTANNIGQILWGHWLEIGDIGEIGRKLWTQSTPNDSNSRLQHLDWREYFNQ